MPQSPVVDDNEYSLLKKIAQNTRDISLGGGVSGVGSVNGMSGIVVLDTGDIASVSNSRYVTDAEKTKLANLSGTNTGDQTNITGNAGTATVLQTARTIDGTSFNGSANITVIAPGTHAATGKTTPVDADEIPLVDSAAANVLKKVTWANVKATLKSYFDTLYLALASLGTNVATSLAVAQDGTSAAAVGFIGVPQVAFSGSATLAASSGGKSLDHTSGSPHTLTIDSHANLPLPVGFTFSIDNGPGAGVVSIEITADTLILAEDGSTGTLELAANGVATFRKVASTTWKANGTGLTPA